MIRAPRLVVPWESRWQSFRTALKPALARSRPRWDGECSLAHANFRSTLASSLLHIALISLVARSAFVQVSPEPQVPLLPENVNIVYFSGSLPPINDAGGAKPGRSGAQGGRAAKRQEQEIKISNEPESADVIAQVQHLNLPRKLRPTANLIALVAEEAPAQVNANAKLRLPDANTVLPIAPSPESLVQQIRQIKAPELQAQVVPPSVEALAQPIHQLEPPDLRTQIVPPPVEIPVTKSTDLSRLTIPNDLTPVVLPPFAARKRPAAPIVSEVAPVQLANNSDSHVLNQLLQSSGTARATLAKQSSGAAANGNSQNGTRASEYVISATIGPEVGLPAQAKPGSGRFSPSGGPTPGLGEKGTGTGSSAGSGEGAAVNTLKGPGAAISGNGPGVPSQATKGNSLGVGKGGSGTGEGQNAGITIRGNTIQLASFAAAEPPLPSVKLPLGPRKPPSVTIIASSRSGGAVNRYGALPGGKVYTIYLDTPAGTATLEFANAQASTRGFEEELTAPEPITTDLPLSLRGARILLQCKMDRDGVMHGFRVLESLGNNLAPAVISALENWRFRPVLQRGESVEVDAIIGLNVQVH